MTISSKLRRVAVAILAAATALAGLVPLTSGGAGAAPGFGFTRLAGADRFDTARRIAVATFGTAETVLLARADLFPDALSGSYLAGSTGQGAPILLTEVNRLPQATNEALSTLGTNRVILLGGPAAISPAVEAELRSRNLQVERIGGRDRFETSQQIAERLGAANVGSVDGERTAVVSSGRNFPDALSGGPVAFGRRLPSLLTDTNTLPTPTRNALTNLGIKRVFLLGGTSAVSGNVETQIQSLGITVERFGGANRQATAVLVANLAIQRLGFDDTHINLARGDAFSDALTGGPHSGDESDGGTTPGAPSAPIILSVSPTILGSESADFLRTRSTTLRDGHIFGGPAAISTAVEDEATRAAGAGRALIVVDQTTVERGGTITGNISGTGINRVTVSGCGFSDREVVRTGNGDFSLTIPSNQPAGTCSLTFRVTFSDGSTETDTIGLTITEPSQLATAAPELVSVSFVRRFIQSPNSGSSYTQTVMRFTFDEPVTGQALVSHSSTACDPAAVAGCSRKFKLYRFDQSPTGNSRRVYEGQSAQVDSADTKSVLVTFGQATGAGSPGSLGEIELRDLTLAAVDENAVQDGSSTSNPYGDVGINTLVFDAGRTIAPDLISVTNFRPNFDGTRTLVDFTFDQPAVPSNDATLPTPPPPAAALVGYHLILNDADVTDLRCNFTPGPTGSTTNGTGTPVHTVSCPTSGLQQITAGAVARGTVDPGTVTSTGSPSTPNPLQAQDVTGDGATTRPDLVSAQFFDGFINGDASGSVDQVLYTFDESVLEPTTNTGCSNTGACFVVYRTDGTEAFGTVAGSPPRRPADNDRQIVVSFSDGSLGSATGASVRAGAVQEAIGTGGVNRFNRQDEVDVQGVTFATGRTTAPDLIACRREVTQRNPVTGAATEFRLVFVFDEDVSPGTAGTGPLNASLFRVYDANGRPVTRVGGTTAVRRTDPADQNEVEVVAYDGANNGQDELRSIVACGVGEGAVSDEEGTDVTAARNPIGYEILTQSA